MCFESSVMKAWQKVSISFRDLPCGSAAHTQLLQGGCTGSHRPPPGLLMCCADLAACPAHNCVSGAGWAVSKLQAPRYCQGVEDAHLGVKVRAALGAAHGQGGEGVLEDLLEAQELDDGQRHRGVEPQAACALQRTRVRIRAGLQASSTGLIIDRPAGWYSVRQRRTQQDPVCSALLLL